MKNNQLYIKIILFTIINVLSAQNNAQSILSSYDFSEKVIFNLPNVLKEISGLTTSEDGRLFGHNDEAGIVYEIDFQDRNIVRSFSPGIKVLYRDFEDIAVLNDKFFLLVSNGDIYEFAESKSKRYSDYKKYNSPFSSKFNFEGMCYDPMSNSLLITAKEYAGKNFKGLRSVFSFDLDKKKYLPNPRYLFSLVELKEKYKLNNFLPTGIEFNPRSKTFFIISSHQESIIEVSPDGKILETKLLSKLDHVQPEGITFNKAGNLLISDEGKNKKGRITLYKLINAEKGTLEK